MNSQLLSNHICKTFSPSQLCYALSIFSSWVLQNISGKIWSPKGSIVKSDQVAWLISCLVSGDNQTITNRWCGRLFANENIKSVDLSYQSSFSRLNSYLVCLVGHLLGHYLFILVPFVRFSSFILFWYIYYNSFL